MIGRIKDSYVVQCEKYAHRWLDAFGVGVAKYIPQNGAPVDDTTGELLGWTATETGTNTVVNSVTANSWLTLTTGATEYNGYSSQVKGTAFKLATDNQFYFYGKFTLADASTTDFLYGLCGTDTTLTAASTAHAIAVSAGGFFFSKISGSTAITFNVYSAGTLVTSIAVGTMDTVAHEYECKFDGQFINVYFDGVLVGRTDTSLPTTVCTPSLSFRTGATAAKVLEMGKPVFIQISA